MWINPKNIFWTLPSFVITLLVVVLSGLPLSYSQSDDQIISGFKSYENIDFQIQIQHPKKWEKSEQDLASNVIVKFTAPDTKDITEPAGLLIGNYPISKDDSLDDFFEFYMKERYSKASEFKLISSENSTISNMKAKKLVLYEYNESPFVGFSGSTTKVIRFITIDEAGNGYFIKYWSEPGLFNKYLPIAEKMISTFKINNENTNSILGPDVTKTVTSTSTVNSPSQNLNTKLLLKWGSPGVGDGQFHEPTDVAVDSENGYVYVADMLNNRIQKFDTNGKYLSQWGKYGISDGQFSHPGDIAVSPWDDSVFVADIDNARIQKFSSNGTFITKWGIFGTEDGQFNHPGDIAFDTSDKSILITDIDNNRIQKFSSNGTFITKWGIFGTEDGQFNQPAGLSFDNINKMLYVADTKNDRIQKFSSNGTFITKWGITGSENGEFKRPTSIAVDGLNKVVYVTDSNNQRIQKFDLYGNFITSWGTQGIGEGQFNRPTGIAFDFPSTVYVSDKENNVIQAFSSPSTTVTKISNDKISENINIQSTNNDPLIAEPIRQTSSIDLNKIPDTLSVTFEGEDNDLPLIGIIDRNDGITIVNDEIDVLDLMFEVDDWNPKLTLQFIDGSDIGLVDVKQTLIGKIKSYSNIQKALTSGLLWKEIPLNQEVVLKIKEKGVNFMIVQVQFTNGATGIYSGVMELKPTINDKSFYKSTLKDDLKDDKSLKVIKSFPPKINNDPSFFQVAEAIVCDNLLNSGFKICE